MGEIKKARMGIITVLVLMLVSITRRLPEARRLSSGITTLALAGIVLLMAVGSASANGVCVWGNVDLGEYYECGDTVRKDCTFNATMVCPVGYLSCGLIIGADDIIVDGYNGTICCGITGTGTPDESIGIYNYNVSHGTYGGGHHNVVIRNLDISGFTDGICVQGTMNSQCTVCRQKVENNNIYNCKVHDNSEGFGINFLKCVCNSTIDSCVAYNTAGTLSNSCDDPGAGIRLWGKSNHNDVTSNKAYNNVLAGIYSKKGCQHNYIFNNVVYENGQTGTNAGFTGGIRFQCKSVHWNTLANNTVTDNIGPGIFIGGNNCNVENNTVTGSTDANTGDNSRGDGLRIDRYPDGGGRNTKVYDNTFCDNEHLDISVQNAAAGAIGDDNTCDTTLNYDDTGITGCTYSCGPAGVCGDVNMDAVVNSFDAIKVKNRAGNPSYPLADEWAADVNCDIVVNSFDAIKVKNRAGNPSYPLNCC